MVETPGRLFQRKNPTLCVRVQADAGCVRSIGHISVLIGRPAFRLRLQPGTGGDGDQPTGFSRFPGRPERHSASVSARSEKRCDYERNNRRIFALPRWCC